MGDGGEKGTSPLAHLDEKKRRRQKNVQVHPALATLPETLAAAAVAGEVDAMVEETVVEAAAVDVVVMVVVVEAEEAAALLTGMLAAEVVPVAAAETEALVVIAT